MGVGVSSDLMLGILGPLVEVDTASQVGSGIVSTVVVIFGVAVGLHRRRCSFTSLLV